jgi:D-arabinose 1-dehydrogenase-like Zn-dependent alcohol dehydrogenase
MKSYQVSSPGKSLELIEHQTPEPQGAEVLVKTIACGVCHSDVHIHSGAFDLGGGNELPVPVRMLPMLILETEGLCILG